MTNEEPAWHFLQFPFLQVWLLLGGDGEVADESLRAGRAVAQALAQYQDVQVSESVCGGREISGRKCQLKQLRAG
jgi:hypothetical protein